MWGAVGGLYKSNVQRHTHTHSLPPSLSSPPLSLSHTLSLTHTQHTFSHSHTHIVRSSLTANCQLQSPKTKTEYIHLGPRVYVYTTHTMTPCSIHTLIQPPFHLSRHPSLKNYQPYPFHLFVCTTITGTNNCAYILCYQGNRVLRGTLAASSLYIYIYKLVGYHVQAPVRDLILKLALRSFQMSYEGLHQYSVHSTTSPHKPCHSNTECIYKSML